MKTLSRRDLLKTSLLAPAAVAAQRMGPNGCRNRGNFPGDASAALNAMPNPSASGPYRERLLLDFGWRFHFGHANDATKDFGFGAGRSGGFQKTGGFLPPSTLGFDDSDWKPVDLPHDWAIGLPLQNDPALASKGSYPAGARLPRDQRGLVPPRLRLPASDAGRRISIEFDGAYRETMVVFNGYYIGRHSGGYDPFSFDLTDFALPGGPNVLLVRVDATLSDGWFYEGAGIYRHVWLVKTAPVHVKKWGTLAPPKCSRGRPPSPSGPKSKTSRRAPPNVRVISTILDPSGKEVGKDRQPRGARSGIGRSHLRTAGGRPRSRRCGPWNSGICTSWSPRSSPAGPSRTATRPASGSAT